MKTQATPVASESRPDYCVSGLDTIEISRAIKKWITDRQAEGWTVEFQIRGRSPHVGVIWQCISHKELHQEFKPCIAMDGETSLMN